MRVLISCPYPLDSNHGNSVSARRLKGIMNEMGYSATAQFGWDGSPADVLIALHAVRSAEVVSRFRKTYPRGKVIVVLTGTDLYQDLLDCSSVGHQTLRISDILVMTQEASLEGFSEVVRAKAIVLRKSVELPLIQFARRTEFPTLVTVGHMRDKRSILSSGSNRLKA